jgi:hypothetical protein
MEDDARAASRFVEEGRAPTPAPHAAFDTQGNNASDPASNIPAMPADNEQMLHHSHSRKSSDTAHSFGAAAEGPGYPLFAGDKPWSQRSWLYELVPFRGMYYDVQRRVPFYVRDWTEAVKPKNWFTIADSIVRMYFIK